MRVLQCQLMKWWFRIEQYRLGQTMISTSLPNQLCDCQGAGGVYRSAQSLLDCDARGCSQTRTNGIAQRLLHNNCSRHQHSSHTSPQKRGWREAQVQRGLLSAVQKEWLCSRLGTYRPMLSNRLSDNVLTKVPNIVFFTGDKSWRSDHPRCSYPGISPHKAEVH